MTKRSATIIGFLVASAIPALQLVVLALVAELNSRPLAFSEALLFVGVSLAVFYPYSLLFTALLGVPAFLFCRKLGGVTWWSALVTGALAGLLVSVFARSGRQPSVEELLKYVPVAAISAIAFWWIWKQGRDPAVNHVR